MKCKNKLILKAECKLKSSTLNHEFLQARLENSHRCYFQFSFNIFPSTFDFFFFQHTVAFCDIYHRNKELITDYRKSFIKTNFVKVIDIQVDSLNLYTI